MNVKTMARGLLAWGAMGSLFVLAIYHAEGLYGFKPFINLEAVLLVVPMTFLMLWVSHPFSDIIRASWAAFSGESPSIKEARRLRGILYSAADSAMAAGAAASMLALALAISSGR